MAAKTAADPGLIAKYARTFGFISLHYDGEWVDIPFVESPDWAKREARKRKDLWKGGNKRAYRLTGTEMEEIFAKEKQEMWEHPAITEKGVVYEDYLEED